MYKRYGDFRASDYTGSWAVMGVMILFVMVSLSFTYPIGYYIIPVIYLFALFYSIWNPNREWFEINDSIIHVKKGKKEKEIWIPEDISIIISPVDICPPLAVRTASGNQTHILKGRYAISILTKMNMEEMIERVHRGQLKKYTTSTIKMSFEEYRYIYSFVCNDNLLEKILSGRSANILIPKTMYSEIRLNRKLDIEICIDPIC